MILTELHQAVLITVAYTLQFDFPLTSSEIFLRLVAHLDDGTILVPINTEISGSQFDRLVAELESAGWFKQLKGLWVMPGFESSVAVRQRRARIAHQRAHESERFVAMVKHLPWIQSVYLTGALAMENAELEEDIDFLIVTKPHRLWLTRLVIAIVAGALGKRRTRDREGRQSWCFNLWLEETELGIFRRRHNLYTAIEILQAKCIFDRGGVGDRLVTTNSWVREFLPNAQSPVVELETNHLKPKNMLVTYLVDPWLQVANWFMYYIQLCYMWSHMTREWVSPRAAFFHPRDTQTWIVQGWAQVLNQVANRYVKPE